jgi:glycosyltransferase 2 family protein
MPMPDVTSLIARSVEGSAQERSAWNWIGFAISLLIVAAAAVVLFHILREIDLRRVFDAMASTSPRSILTAACFVAVGYVTLTFYDFFSLRTIGCRHVPYRVAALASFTSYSIGHNLGATVFTAGAVRWRIYSAWNLSLTDVAKMAFVTGLTFWLGNVVVLASGMIVAPEAVSAVDQLPPALNQAIGAAGLAVVALYLIWLLRRQRVIGRGTWAVVLPNAPLTLVQIGIGVLDLAAGGGAMLVLLPNAPEVDFVIVFVVFAAAMLLGFLSHAPGSLGVFEASMLLALPQFAKEELLAALLIFRCLYFVLPFILALGLLAGRELWLAARER